MLSLVIPRPSLAGIAPNLRPGERCEAHQGTLRATDWAVRATRRHKDMTPGANLNPPSCPASLQQSEIPVAAQSGKTEWIGAGRRESGQPVQPAGAGVSVIDLDVDSLGESQQVAGHLPIDLTRVDDDRRYCLRFLLRRGRVGVPAIASEVGAIHHAPDGRFEWTVWQARRPEDVAPRSDLLAFDYPATLEQEGRMSNPVRMPRLNVSRGERDQDVANPAAASCDSSLSRTPVGRFVEEAMSTHSRSFGLTGFSIIIVARSSSYSMAAGADYSNHFRLGCADLP